MIIKILTKAIKIYQTVLSPDHSFWGNQRFPYGYCRFSPSCSEYGKQALEKHGLVGGLWRVVARIGRCNPFHPGGFDPVT